MLCFTLSIVDKDLHYINDYAQELSCECDEALIERVSKSLVGVVVICGHICKPVCFILYFH